MPFERSNKNNGEERRRATLEALAGQASMPAVTRSRATSARRRTLSKKVRVIRGKIRLRVSGYSGLRLFSPAHLIRHITASKLRLAAKKFLRLKERGATGQKTNRRRKGRRRGQKKRQGKLVKKGKKKKRATGKTNRRTELRRKRKAVL